MPKSHDQTDSACGSVTAFFKAVTAGDAASMQPLWDTYFPGLLRLARKTLGDGHQRVAGPDDAVQSAFIAFWQQASQKQFDGTLHRDNLWSVLAVMTVCKARKQVRREQARKRGGDRIRVQLDDIASPQQAMDSLSPQEFDLYSQELLLALPEDLMTFALHRLMGFPNAEIAEAMGCTERTVERKLRRIRLEWKDLITN